MARMIMYVFTIVTLQMTLWGIACAGDITVQMINCPRTVKAGQDLSPSLRVVVGNNGEKAIRDASISMVLRKNSVCAPAGRAAVYSPQFFDGVLLKDGRQYVSVEPGQKVTVKPYGPNTIPADTPVGRSYFICADIGHRESGKKTDEPGTCACCQIKVIGTEARPVITGFAEACVAPGGTTTILGRGFGSGSDKVAVMEGEGMRRDLQVISWSDNTIVVRMPDDTGIREGRSYSIVIQRSDRTEFLSNRKTINICQERRRQPPATPLPPVSPFLH